MGFGRIMSRAATWALTGLMFTTFTAQAEEGEKETQAEAAPAPAAKPDTRLYLTQLDVIRYHPLGLETQNRLLYSKRLMDSDSVLFSNTYVAGGLGLKLNPAFVKIGPEFEIQPIALFNLRGVYEYMSFFGTAGFVQSYPDPTDPDAYADDNRSVAADNGENYKTSGHHFYLQPTVQAKVGPVAIRARFTTEYWNMDLSGDHDGDGVDDGDTVWYDATLDTYVPAKGWVFTNDTDVLYLAGPKLTAGVRVSSVWPQYTDANFPNGEPADWEGANHSRVGPLAAYKVGKEKKVTILGVLGWYLKHPNREGSLPYILVGVSWNKDLLK